MEYLLYTLFFTFFCCFIIFAISVFNKPNSENFFKDEKELAIFLNRKMYEHFSSAYDQEDFKKYCEICKKNIDIISGFAISLSEKKIKEHSNNIQKTVLENIVQSFLNTMVPVIAICIRTGTSFTDALEEYNGSFPSIEDQASRPPETLKFKSSSACLEIQLKYGADTYPYQIARIIKNDEQRIIVETIINSQLSTVQAQIMPPEKENLFNDELVLLQFSDKDPSKPPLIVCSLYPEQDTETGTFLIKKDFWEKYNKAS